MTNIFALVATLITLFCLTFMSATHAVIVPVFSGLPLAHGFAAKPTLPTYKSYRQQPYWQAFQQYLPPDYHMTAQQLPHEYFWSWRDHQIHVDHFPQPHAKAKLILIHGLSTHGRHMSMILGKPMADAGYEVYSLDLPLYGLTRSYKRKPVSYDDWVQMLHDFVTQEAHKDDLPIFIYGLSAGGMLAYHAANQNPYVKGVMGSSFLDLSRPEVRAQTIRFYRVLDYLIPGLKLSADIPIRHLRLPISLVAKVKYTVNQPEAMNSLLLDPSSAGNRLSLGFFDSLLHYQPVQTSLRPRPVPLLLTQFEHDNWTPSRVNELFIQRFSHLDVHVEYIPDAGHFPIESKGLKQLHRSVIDFIERYR